MKNYDKFRSAYRKSQRVIQNSVDRTGIKEVNIQDLDDEELDVLKFALKDQIRSINKEIRRKVRIENAGQTKLLVSVISIALVIYLGFLAAKGIAARDAILIDHSEEIISQYNNSQNYQPSNEEEGIFNWIKGLTDSLLDNQKGMGGK